MILDELEALASKATPGPWEDYTAPCCPDMGGVTGPKGSVCADKLGRYGHPMSAADAAFIAAMDPTTALKLIAVARAAVTLARFERSGVVDVDVSWNTQQALDVAVRALEKP